MDISESVVYRRAFGLASDLAEALEHRIAGRLHDAPGAGGGAAEVRRRLDVAPELAALDRGAVAEAVARSFPKTKAHGPIIRMAGRGWLLQGR